MRLSLRPIFLQPGRPLTRISYQQLGAVLDNVPLQGFFEKAGATFRLKDGVLAYARVRRLLCLVKDLITGRTSGTMGPFLLPSSLDISFSIVSSVKGCPKGRNGDSWLFQNA